MFGVSLPRCMIRSRTQPPTMSARPPAARTASATARAAFIGQASGGSASRPDGRVCAMLSAYMDPAIRLLRELVAINSINPTLVGGAPGEAEVAEAVAIEMRRLALDVSIEMVAPGRPNVIGVLEGRSKGRTLMFCGHTDTVGVAGMRDPFTPI